MKCTRCGSESIDSRTLSCAHTEDKEVCTECYQQVHWLLTAAAAADNDAGNNSGATKGPAG